MKVYLQSIICTDCLFCTFDIGLPVSNEELDEVVEFSGVMWELNVKGSFLILMG